MKVKLEDRITKRIKKVMVQYEPEYSPLAWERLKKQLPVPESRVKKLLGKHSSGFFLAVIAGVLIIVYTITSLLPVDKNSVTDPRSSESENYSVTGTTEETGYSKKPTIIRHENSNIIIEQEKKSISSDIIPVQITDPYLATDKDKVQSGGAVEGISEVIKNDFVPPVMIEGTDFCSQEIVIGLIPIESRDEDIRLWKDRTNEKKRKLKFNSPDFNLLFLKDKSYDKFTGPDKLAIYYSPEIHRSDSLKTLGVSQGIGISFEGPVRPLISISAGLSYQSIDFHKTLFVEKVPPHLVLQPDDTSHMMFYYLDSIGIRSGSYKFLELPVAVNYRFIESHRSQVWLSAGLSSIVYLGQKYFYETIVEKVHNSSSISIKEWGNIHPLASVNFGILYRYNISDRYLLQSSMQYKHHLTPLGYYSMKINRLEFQIGLIYYFGHHK
jgi:hypothetical protein